MTPTPQNHKTHGPILVVGTGRSGTHFLGRILREHPLVYATIEQEPIFGWATGVALYPNSRQKMMPYIVDAYHWQLTHCPRPFYADKSHPNLWLAEDLAEAFPEARFLAITRDPFGTISSMLQHDGVQRWSRNWREYPLPNPFLGITEEVIDKYEDIPLAARCALRWKSHDQRIRELATKLENLVLTVNYESLILEPEMHLRRIEEFLGLPEPIPLPEIKASSLNKWREHLGDEQIREIAEVVGFGPSETTSQK